MKRVIEVTASFTGKISTGQFENSSPFYSVKESIELDSDFTDVDMWINSRQSELQEMCRNQFKKVVEIEYQEKVAKAYSNIRFYDAGNGQKYPSVTSVIGMDDNFFMAPDELAQYGARGHVLHKQIEIFLSTGKWIEPKEISEIAFQVATVLKGTLGLSLDDVNFVNFFNDYPFKVIAQEKTVINHEFKYAGRLDIIGVIESTNKGKWDKIEGVVFDTPTIFDVKTSTTLDKLKAFTQEAAYAKTDDTISQMVIIHLNKENACGYGKPAVTGKLEHYWSIFLNHREKFRSRYGV